MNKINMETLMKIAEELTRKQLNIPSDRNLTGYEYAFREGVLTGLVHADCKITKGEKDERIQN